MVISDSVGIIDGRVCISQICFYFMQMLLDHLNNAVHILSIDPRQLIREVVHIFVKQLNQ